MPEDDIERGSFTVVSIDSLLSYEKKYSLQLCLGYCAYKVIDKQMIDYLDDNFLGLMKIRSYKCSIIIQLI